MWCRLALDHALYYYYWHVCLFLFSGLRGAQWDLSNGGPGQSSVCGVSSKLGHKPPHFHDVPHNNRCVLMFTLYDFQLIDELRSWGQPRVLTSISRLPPAVWAWSKKKQRKSSVFKKNTRLQSLGICSPRIHIGVSGRMTNIDNDGIRELLLIWFWHRLFYFESHLASLCGVHARSPVLIDWLCVNLRVTAQAKTEHTKACIWCVQRWLARAGMQVDYNRANLVWIETYYTDTSGVYWLSGFDACRQNSQ